MEKDPDSEELVASVDLTFATAEQLDFLEAVAGWTELHEGPVVRDAIRRYLHCWLPLLAECRDLKELLPPLDVHWVWYCHCLSPNIYREDVQALVGTDIHHAWVPQRRRTKAMKNAISLWITKFEDEPFDRDNTKVSDLDIPDSSVELMNKLEKFVLGEKNFFYQFALPHNRKEEFIEKAVTKYKGFLGQAKKTTKITEVPSDVELVWRSHILQSESYSKDCQRWFGCLMDHNSTTTVTCPQRNKCTLMQESPKRGLPAAQNMSNVRHHLRRGDSPIGRLGHVPEAELLSISAKICEIQIEEIFIDGYKIDAKGTSVTVTLDLSGRRDNHHVSKRVTDFSGTHYSPTEKKSIVFSVDPGRYDALTLTLTKKSGSMLKASKSTQGAHTFNLIPLIETCPSEGTTFSESGSFDIKGLTVHVSVRGSISPSDRGAVHLCHVPGSCDVRMCAEGEEERQILRRSGLTPVEVHNLGDICISTHRFINRSSRLVFTCKFHQKVPHLSLIQVLWRDQLVAEGHYLPTTALPHQEIDDIPYLEEGEQGYVVKNGQGDWCVLVGKLDASAPGRGNSQPASLMRLFTIGPVSKRWDTSIFRVPKRDGSFLVESGGISLDLKTGNVTIHKSCSHVAEAVALTYGIASLHALLWRASKGPLNSSGKTVRFAGQKTETWADIARGTRFLKLINMS